MSKPATKSAISPPCMGTAIHSMSRGRAGSFRGSIRASVGVGIATVALIAGAVRADPTPDALAPFRALDPVVAARVLALNPGRLSAADVRDTLAHIPAPRIYLLQGSVAFVSMAPFAEFLAAMGYPEERLRNARDGRYSRSSFTDSAEVAGEIAWDYEHDGLMPMLIGHSQGGMLAIRVLYEFAGEFSPAIAVRDPATGTAQDRTVIRDPLTGAMRPVVGLQVGYA